MAGDSTNSEAARGVLADSVGRVRSMALIHQHLYGFDSLDRINLAVYAKTQSDSVREAMGPKVSIAIEAGSVSVGVDVAVPLALILNELLTNALKYGISESRRPDMPADIVVRIAPGATDLTVEVLDCGPGLSEGVNLASVDPNSPALGLKLVSALSRQIRAKVTPIRAPCAGVRLVIPNSEL